MTGVSLAGTQLRVNQYKLHDQEWNDVKVIFEFFFNLYFIAYFFWELFKFKIVVVTKIQNILLATLISEYN